MTPSGKNVVVPTEIGWVIAITDKCTVYDGYDNNSQMTYANFYWYPDDDRWKWETDLQAAVLYHREHSYAHRQVFGFHATSAKVSVNVTVNFGVDVPGKYDQRGDGGR